MFLTVWLRLHGEQFYLTFLMWYFLKQFKKCDYQRIAIWRRGTRGGPDVWIVLHQPATAAEPWPPAASRASYCTHPAATLSADSDTTDGTPTNTVYFY